MEMKGLFREKRIRTTGTIGGTNMEQLKALFLGLVALIKKLLGISK